ncbi:MAG: threonylcarbamoyl-AMP synthase [Clostridia bacterium]|nr:threonylcarbamoyl-AMP synthase [Clostridia bacterium]
MDTKVLKPTEENIRYAGSLIAAGQLVAFPTETVYGLGADARNGAAVASIFRAKGRPGDNPLIVHVSESGEILPLVSGIPAQARILMEHFWPGPMTLIFPRSDRIPDEVSAGLDTVGIRMPSNPVARELIRRSGCPIAAPSANRSGRPSPTTAAHVYEDMNGRIPVILDGGPCEVGLESTVIDARGPVPVILRPGGITPEMIRAVAGDVRLDEHIMAPVAEGERVRSPGMKYRHYAPEARTVIFEGTPEKVIAEICRRYDAEQAAGGFPAILGFETHDYGGRRVLSLGVPEHPDEAAGRLFAALRELDTEKRTLALCEAVSLEGIGLAVMNRMGRAAAFDIIRIE